MPWFWDLVELSTKIPLRFPQWHNQSPKTTFQPQIPQEYGVFESSCVVLRLLQEGQRGFSGEVADRIKVPQREFLRPVYDSRWAIFQENQVDFTNISIPQVGDFWIICLLIRT